MHNMLPKICITELWPCCVHELKVCVPAQSTCRTQHFCQCSFNEIAPFTELQMKVTFLLSDGEKAGLCSLCKYRGLHDVVLNLIEQGPVGSARKSGRFFAIPHLSITWSRGTA
jgi:hypothetical protein